MKCMANGCNRLAISKKCCDKHYRRILKNGDMNNPGSRVVEEGNDLQRFHKKYEINENGCWIWTAGKRPNSKGVLYPRHHTQLGSIGAHRFSYSIYIESIPKGMMVCHKCDTPLCVNPDHLFLGYHKDNMCDMVNKGRSYRGQGEFANSSKLTNEQANQIRSMSGSQSDIAKHFGISQATVSQIKRFITYKNAI